MISHTAQVIESYIRGDLKLQHRAALLQRLDQRLPLRSPQVRRIQPVADPHKGHFLSRRQCFSDTLYAAGNVVAQPVVLTCMDSDHKSRILLRDMHQLMDHRRNIPDII